MTMDNPRNPVRIRNRSLTKKLNTILAIMKVPEKKWVMEPFLLMIYMMPPCKTKNDNTIRMIQETTKFTLL